MEGTVTRWYVEHTYELNPRTGAMEATRANIFRTQVDAEAFASSISGAFRIRKEEYQKSRHYLIVNNEDSNLFWNWDVSTGEWAKKGSYYPDEESAQEDIDANGLNAHVEYDVW